MKYQFRIAIVILILSHLTGISQNTFPRVLDTEEFPGKLATEVISKYDFNKDEKKAFLFFDIESEPLAEVMYNGCNFAFDRDKITIFPVFFTGQLLKKQSKDFTTTIPVQLFKTPLKSCFKEFNLSEEDLPILVVYSSNSLLCGFARTTEEISMLNCNDDDNQRKFLRLKILVEEKSKKQKAYANKDVYVIQSGTNDTIAKVKTNKEGNFSAEISNLQQDYLISVNDKDKNKSFLILATQAGVEVGKFSQVDNGFLYTLLKAEMMTLPDIKTEEEIEMKLDVFKVVPDKEFVVTENLYYPLGKERLTKSSKQILDKIAKLLLENLQFQVEVISHTDAQGNDADNLKLSVKRSEVVVGYLKSKGIDKKRLKAEGKGETQIRNRCGNDVECSDMEHEYNRRTEFKFTK